MHTAYVVEKKTYLVLEINLFFCFNNNLMTIL